MAFNREDELLNLVKGIRNDLNSLGGRDKSIEDENNQTRNDMNTMAIYIKDTEKDLIKNIGEIEVDFKSLENDIKKALSQIQNNNQAIVTSIDSEYIKQLISKDFEDMQQSLLEQIKQLLQG